MAGGFKLVINIAGLVVWYPIGDGRRASLIGVRTGGHGSPSGEGSLHPGSEGSSHGHRHSGPSHAHTASLAYMPEKLAGLDNAATAAPDPLYTDPGGYLFARRTLHDEILWLEPTWADGNAHLLEAEVPNLLSLSEIEPRADGIHASCLGPDLAGSPAVSRLDVAAGRLVEKESLQGKWQLRSSQEIATPEVGLTQIAVGLQLILEPLRSCTLHSNKAPALRFASDGPVVLSYTVEPARDFVPSVDDFFPHFESLFEVVRWHEERPERFRKPALTSTAAPWLTIKDRACPPGKD